MLIELQQGRLVGDFIRHLERQTARRIRRQMQKIDMFPLFARQLRPVFCHRVAEFNLAARNNVTAEYPSEGFAHGPQLKQGLLSDGFIPVDIGFTPGEIVRFTLINDRDGHTGDSLFLHKWGDGAIDDVGKLFVCCRCRQR
ncbi:hypothetical protein D3C86_1833850 [compost metagenome]